MLEIFNLIWNPQEIYDPFIQRKGLTNMLLTGKCKKLVPSLIQVKILK